MTPRQLFDWAGKNIKGINFAYATAEDRQKKLSYQNVLKQFAHYQEHRSYSLACLKIQPQFLPNVIQMKSHAENLVSLNLIVYLTFQILQVLSQVNTMNIGGWDAC